MGKAKGISGLVLLPARDYEWELISRQSLEVPKEGKISELLNDKELASGVKIPGDDEFSIFEDNLFLFWELTRVLFSKGNYPDLKDGQFFNALAVEIKENSIMLHGEILKLVTE